MDATVLSAVALAGFLIGFGKSGVAGTLGPFVTVVVALALPADDAIGLLLPMLMVGDAFSVAAHWRQWDGALVARLVPAALLGIGGGTIVISVVDAGTLRSIIAVLMLFFVVAYAGVRRMQIGPERLGGVGWLAGATSGLTSTLAHLGGPPVVAYLMSTPLDPRRLVATSVAFFAAINLLKVPGYFVARLFDGALIVSTIWAWALIPVGVLAGRWMVERIDRRRFDAVALVLLTAGAVLLLVT